MLLSTPRYANEKNLRPKEEVGVGVEPSLPAFSLVSAASDPSEALVLKRDTAVASDALWG